MTDDARNLALERGEPMTDGPVIDEQLNFMGLMERTWYMRIIRLLYDHPALGPRGNEFIAVVEHMRQVVQGFGVILKLSRQGKDEQALAAMVQTAEHFDKLPQWVLEDFGNGNHNGRR